MEQTPPVPTEGTSLFEMELDALGQNHLKNISGWGKFIAITGLIIVGLCIILLAISHKEIGEEMGKLFALDNTAAGVLIAILAVFGGMALLLLIFLLKACVLIKQGLVSQNSDRIAEGFKALKIVFTISVIFSAISILLVIFNLINS
jgi:hypothetical protein